MTDASNKFEQPGAEDWVASGYEGYRKAIDGVVEHLHGKAAIGLAGKLNFAFGLVFGIPDVIKGIQESPKEGIIEGTGLAGGIAGGLGAALLATTVLTAMGLGAPLVIGGVALATAFGSLYGEPAAEWLAREAFDRLGGGRDDGDRFTGNRDNDGNQTREGGGGKDDGFGPRDGGWHNSPNEGSQPRDGGFHNSPNEGSQPRDGGWHNSPREGNGTALISPIVLDMDRDGKIELAHKSAGAFFDMDNDGIRDATAWVGKDDGLLVIDLAANGTAGADGVINQSSEVVFTNWVAGSTSDMAAVKAVFDSNKNGLLDEDDGRWSEFRIWQDKNGDGISQQGELKTLTELGIKSIDLTPKGDAVTMKDGSVVTGTSTVTMTNGTTMLAGDSTFKYVNTGEGKAVEYNADGTPKTQATTEIVGGDGRDVLVGTTGNDTLVGGNGKDRLFGGEGNDTLFGGNGKDRLFGDAGDDLLNGGNGKDRLFGGDGADTLNGGAGIDRIYGGNGIDTASYVDANSGVVVDLRITGWQFTGGGGSDKLKSIESLAGSSHDDTLIGNNGANTLSGNGGDDVLVGGVGNDTLLGGTGDDVLFGGVGNDALNGGEGFDIASYAGATKAVTVDLTNTAAQNTGGDGTDTLTSIEGVYGTSFNDVLTGNDEANYLGGGAGNDTLNGGKGDDWLSGGAGNDVINGGEGSDTVSYADSRFGVTVDLNVSTSQTIINTSYTDTYRAWGGRDDGYVMRTKKVTVLDRDTLISVENLVGSGQGDKLTGNAESNLLYGGDGADTITAGAGDDLVNGGAGSDRLFGGDGIDTLSYADSAFGVTVDLSVTTAQNVATIARRTFETDTISGFENLIGSDKNDTLTGTSGDNLLAGGAGNDTLTAGAGNDAVYGSDGDDTANAGTGNDLVYGGAGNDTLNGDAGKDTILGGEGNDTIRAGQDNDVISGGAGADALYGDDGNDIITFDDKDTIVDGGNGYDIALFEGSVLTSTQVSNIEALLMSDGATTFYTRGADGSTNITSGDGNDSLVGGVGDDIFFGGGGNDTLVGLAGDDVLDGGTGNDSIAGGAGNDLLSGGTGSDALDGGAGDDLILFSAEDSFLNGGSGNDVAIATGADGVALDMAATSIEMVFGTLAADRFFGGSDAITVFAGGGADEVYGGSGDDLVFDGDGNDIVNGGAGNDLIWVGAGNDRFTGGAGEDVFVFLGKNGNDVVSDFSSADKDLLVLDKAVFKDFDALKAVMSDTDQGLLFKLSADDSLTLQGVKLADFSEKDFLLV